MAKKRRALSHSAREQYKSCNRAFLLGREQRFEPNEDKASLKMGRAFSKAVELRDPDKATEGYYEQTPVHLRIINDQSKVEIAQVELLTRLYLERYASDYNADNIVTNEFEFKSDTLGHGFLDGVIEQHGTAGYGQPARIHRTGVENKLLTKGLFWNDTSIKVLAIDDQVTAYFAAMREIGKPLDRMLYRVTFKPSIKPDYRKGKDANFAAYMDRLEAKILADPSAAFEEHELYRTEDELDRFIEECAEVNKQIALSRRTQAWPKNTKSCTMFGGCKFLPICRNEPDIADRFHVRPLPAPKPKLPRLGKVQKSVLLAIGDAFTTTVELTDVARQVGRGASEIHGSLAKLVERGYVLRDDWCVDDGHDGSRERTDYSLSPEGQDIVKLLAA